MDNSKQGIRVELIYMNDKFTTLKAGDRGTIELIDDANNIHVKWDNGSSLSLIPGVDVWVEIGECK